MILIELQYDSIDSAFLTLFDKADPLLDEAEFYWVTISSSGDKADLDSIDLRKVPLAHA